MCIRDRSDDIKQSVNIKLESSFDVVNSRFDSNDKKFDAKFGHQSALTSLCLLYTS